MFDFFQQASSFREAQRLMRRIGHAWDKQAYCEPAAARTDEILYDIDNLILKLKQTRNEIEASHVS